MADLSVCTHYIITNCVMIVGIYIKTKKAQTKDGFGNKIKYDFHITTLHYFI